MGRSRVVAWSRWFAEPDAPWSPYLPALGLGLDAASPQGFSQWTESVPGPHLGREINWEDFPEHIRAHLVARVKQRS